MEESDIAQHASSPPPSPSSQGLAEETATPPFPMSRPPKRFRPPVSIFDLPCPPTAAPPHDDSSFFNHLDSIQETLDEENSGKVPKSLEAGPQILVESLNKSRRKIQAQESEEFVNDCITVHPSNSPSLEHLSFESTSSTGSQSERLRKKVQFNLNLNKEYQVPRSERNHPRTLIVAGPADSMSETLPVPRPPSPPLRTSKKDPKMMMDEQDLEVTDQIEDWHSSSDSPPAEDPVLTENTGSASTVVSNEHHNLGDLSAPGEQLFEEPPRPSSIVFTPQVSKPRNSSPAPPTSHHDLSGSSPEPVETSSSASVHASTTTRPRKGKEPVRSVATLIGSRRKQPAAPVRIPSLQRAPSVIAIDDENDDADIFLQDARRTNTPEPRPIPPPTASHGETTGPSKPGHLSSETGASLFSWKPTSSVGALEGLYIYVIPQNMDTGAFNAMRDRVIQLKGHWLGPKTKSLAADPRAKSDLPVLDQEKTTHIVTALTNIQTVKRHLNVEEIHPRIAVVNREWLSDTITYKRPMDPESYTLSRPDIVASARSPRLDAPLSIQSRRNAEGSQDQEGIDNEHQTTFKEIMQGIQEGSLEDAEMSDPDEGEEKTKDDGEDKTRLEQGKVSLDDGKAQQEADSHLALQPSSDVLGRLKRENRCFKCQQVGHWMRDCPKRPLDSDQEKPQLQIANSGRPEGKRRKVMYQCESPHVANKEEPRYNKAVLEQLKVLMDHYDTIKHQGSKEHFKVINYRKAITAIRALDYDITSEEMALKVPRVGKKIAQKIGECVALGRIKKLDHLHWDKDRLQVETLFRSVYGVGTEKATEWYNSGLRTLDDLRQLPDLTKNQSAGLKYFNDLQKRVPRTEVEQIAKVVEDTAKELHSDIQCQVTGSYRRGHPDCGDIDIVVARPNVDNGDELFMIIEHILKDLMDRKFLVDHLSVPSWADDMANQPKHFKYMGICRLLGEDTLHRHIDILVVPWLHLGAVLLYFTGNDICNRSMRLMARKRGMRLSDKGLFEDVIRHKNGKKINEGRWVAGRTEKEIFEYLKIDYLEPYERDC